MANHELASTDQVWRAYRAGLVGRAVSCGHVDLPETMYSEPRDPADPDCLAESCAFPERKEAYGGSGVPSQCRAKRGMFMDAMDEAGEDYFAGHVCGANMMHLDTPEEMILWVRNGRSGGGA